MKQPLRFAIVGYGNIGRRHAAHIESNDHTSLVAVCDVRPEVAKVLPEGVAFYTSLDEMLRQGGIDVLSVCTPNYLHEPHTIAGLNAGVHTVVEKPMAMSSDECDRMIAAAEANGKIIFAVKQNRYNPPVAEVKKLVSSEQLGAIYTVQVNCFWNRGDGGIL